MDSVSVDREAQVSVPYPQLSDAPKALGRGGGVMNEYALYYPYIHIRDESWLKAAMLYWPGIGRFRPRDYPTHDGRATAIFKERGWLHDLEPGPHTRRVA